MSSVKCQVSIVQQSSRQVSSVSAYFCAPGNWQLATGTVAHVKCFCKCRQVPSVSASVNRQVSGVSDQQISTAALLHSQSQDPRWQDGAAPALATGTQAHRHTSTYQVILQVSQAGKCQAGKCQAICASELHCCTHNPSQLVSRWGCACRFLRRLASHWPNVPV